MAALLCSCVMFCVMCHAWAAYRLSEFGLNNLVSCDTICQSPKYKRHIQDQSCLSIWPEYTSCQLLYKSYINALMQLMSTQRCIVQPGYSSIFHPICPVRSLITHSPTSATTCSADKTTSESDAMIGHC